MVKERHHSSVVKFSLQVWKVHRSELHRATNMMLQMFCFWARHLALIASLTRAFLVPVVCEEYYNLSADRTCWLQSLVRLYDCEPGAVLEAPGAIIILFPIIT